MTLSTEERYVYQLAARYSGRLSFAIFTIVFTWVGVKGLKKMLTDASMTYLLFSGLFLLAFNHLIHFGLLYKTHELLGWELFTSRSGGGTIGYIALILLPIILWKKKQYTNRLYWLIVCCFVYLEIIFFVSYYGRSEREQIYMSDSKLFFDCCVALVIVLFLINCFTVVKEQLRGQKIGVLN